MTWQAAILVFMSLAASFIIIPKIINEDGSKPDYKSVYVIIVFITLISIFLNNIQLFYAVIAVIFFIFLKTKKIDGYKLFMLLPTFANPVTVISGFGIVQTLIAINYYFVLIIIFFMMVFFSHKKIKNKVFSDYLIIIFFIWISVLDLRGATVTHWLRSIIENSVTILMPYFIIRSLVTNISQQRDIFIALALSGVFLGAIAFNESIFNWLLYGGVRNWDAVLNSTNLKLNVRGSLLRVTATMDHPIVLGYISSMCLIAFLTISGLWRNPVVRLIILGSITIALLAPLSRGPWLGAAIGVFFYFLLRGKLSKLIAMGFLGLILLVGAMSISPAVNTKVINLLGLNEDSHEASTVDYRSQLFSQSLIVIQRNLLTGSIDYLETPEMEEMRQGQGIIDLVNSYLQYTLHYGLGGVLLFISVFMAALFKAFKNLKNAKYLGDAHQRYLVCLIAMTLSTIVVIFTVSSIGYIPIFYWMLAGMLTSFTIYIEKTYKDEIKSNRITP